MVGTKNLTADDVWQKARLATEANRPRAVRDAVAIVSPESVGLVTELFNSPVKFLAGNSMALRKARKEVAALALIRMAASDADGAANMMDTKWGNQLTSEERNWVWGVIGKQTATRLGNVPGSQALATSAGSARKATSPTTCWAGKYARPCVQAASPTGQLFCPASTP